MSEGNFNLRVYGLIINENNQILLSDEYRLNTRMTKFPGGGMNYGEGPIDCLKREAIEEFGQEIDVLEHFYTTHYFQQARFYEHTQLISIYYTAQFREAIRFKISQLPFDFKDNIEGNQSFRWRNLSELSLDELTFPIDKYVVQLLKEKLQ